MNAEYRDSRNVVVTGVDPYMVDRIRSTSSEGIDHRNRAR